MIVLYRLSAATLLHPQCFVLKGIVLSDPEDYWALGDMYRARHGNQTLCLKVIQYTS